MEGITAASRRLANRRPPWGTAGHVVSLLRRRVATPLVLALFLPGFASPGRCKGLPFARIPLRVSTQGDLGTFWKVRAAEIRETLTATWGYLRVENISGRTLSGAVFYGEYFDGAGRFCFSLAFSQDKNIGERGPAAPGAIREFFSSAGGLAPASDPQVLRLYLLRAGTPGGSNSSRERVSVRAPAISIGSLPAGADGLQLGTELGRARAPILDVVLAEVAVDATGSLERVDVLDAASNEVESWFLGFVKQMAFYPATEGGMPRPSEALVLVRAVLSGEGVLETPFPAHASLWVQAYTKRFTGLTVPVIVQLLFERPPTRVKQSGSMEWTQVPPAAPGLFQAMLVQGDWGTPAFGWVPDPSMPHHLRRVLVAPEPR